MKTLNRRRFLTAAAIAGGALVTSRASFAVAGKSDARLVLVLLRGGLDGLSAVPPYGDPDYARLRRELAIGQPGTDGGAFDLDGFFGLHPSLAFLHEAYEDKELAVLHASATPYRDRSHFDGQNVLESGFPQPHADETGWLNRALASLPAERGAGAEPGVALGQNVPLVLRGPAPVASWSPSRLAPLEEDTLERIRDLYANDALLSTRLADALAANERAAAGMSADEPAPRLLAQRGLNRGQGNARLVETVNAAAGFLRGDGGASVAVFDTTGWDTHANEGAAQGQLALRLASLDAGLRALKQQLGPVWSRTAIFIATEFGRTAAGNGSRGTDHGTAGAGFVVGPKVARSTVFSDWPGLGDRALFEGRDLKPTLDTRAVLKAAVAGTFDLTPAQADRVFPDSAGIRGAYELMG